MSSRKIRYKKSDGSIVTEKFSFNKNKKYKFNKSTGAVEEFTGTPAEDEITIPGSKSSLRRLAEVERNISILASKSGVAGQSNSDTDVLLKTEKAADSDKLDGLDSSAFALASHNHDDRYFTEAEADARYASKEFVNGAYVDFTVGGDANTYYPVSIQNAGAFAFNTYTISRSYSWTAPTTWNTSTHKGGLTLTWQFPGDSFWGGNDKSIRIVEFGETYTTMVGGMAGSVGGGGTHAGVVVWLRGGNALYRFHGPRGALGDVNVHLTTVTASNGATFAPKAYSSTDVQNQIYNRWPVRNEGSLHSNGNMTVSGSITATGDVTAYSDDSLKTNVQTIDGALSKVNQVRGVTYDRIEDGSTSTGVIAQELEAVLPEAVHVDANGMRHVAYGNVVGLLIESVKELTAEVEKLKNQK